MEEEISKSQKKRDADALQKIGVSLIDWSIDKIDKLPLPDNLRKAIIDAKSIKSHGAKRRQAQFIGKLMRTSDLDTILPIYEDLIADESAQTAAFHEIECWRTRLIEEGNTALTEFIDTFHPEDVQQLKHLIKKAQQEQSNSTNLGASRTLFRYIRSCIK